MTARDPQQSLAEPNFRSAAVLWAAVAGSPRYHLTIPGRLVILLLCQLFGSSTKRAANFDVVNSADTAIEATLTAGDIGHVAYSFDPKLRRTRYRADWWDPRLEETFRLRLGQVRGSIEELFGRSLGQRLPRPREVCITRPLSMGLCEASRLQNMYWPPFKWMACPLTKLPVVQR